MGKVTSRETTAGETSAGQTITGNTAVIMPIGRHTCSAILHQDKNRIQMSMASIAAQHPSKLRMFDENTQYPMPVIAFYHNYGAEKVSFAASKSRAKPGPYRHPKKYQSPIYEIKIGGLCSQNYAAVNFSNYHSFHNILAIKDLYEDHPRMDNLTLDAVRHLQPGFSGEVASREWFREDE